MFRCRHAAGLHTSQSTSGSSRGHRYKGGDVHYVRGLVENVREALPAQTRAHDHTSNAAPLALPPRSCCSATQEAREDHGRLALAQPEEAPARCASTFDALRFPKCQDACGRAAWVLSAPSRARRRCQVTCVADGAWVRSRGGARCHLCSRSNIQGVYAPRFCHSHLSFF